MILRNARVDGRVVDVRLNDGAIAEIGSIDGSAGDADIDLEGRWLGPGLWDQHVHANQWALSRQRFDLSFAASAAEVVSIVAAASRPAAGLVLVGHGFRDGLWPDAPSVAALDAAAPDVPVVLVSADLHCCWLNSLALERFGYLGHPTGLFREEACFAIVRALDTVPDDVLDGWVAEAGKAASARGVVGIVDLEMEWGFDAWQRRMLAGFDSLRIRAGVYPPYLDRAIADGLRTGDRLGELLEVGPFKILTDGSLNTRTAYCAEPYPGLGERGLLTVQPDELVDWLTRASAAGLSPAVHAIGDEANRLALNAFASVGCDGRIEHAQLVAESDFARFGELGVAASVQPEHAMDDRDVADRYWHGRTDRTMALRSLLNGGARLVFGSDAPVAPLDPWVTIAAAVSRSRDGREAWHPEQRISVAEALEASVQSRVAAGEVADLVATDVDPLATDAAGLRSMPVALTVLGGRVTHSAL